MFGIGIPELVLILIVGLIVFGPSKLPEVGRAVGKGIREFRRASSALTAAIDEETRPVPQHPQAAQTMTPTSTQDMPADINYAPPTQESVKTQLEAAATVKS